MSSFQEMSDLRRLTDPAILEARAKKEYRPVAVAVIADRRGRILLVQSQKNTDDWGLPQGGIEPDEDLPAALVREIKEETGIDEDRLEFAGYVGMTDLDAEAGRKDKRGYAKGKRYFAVRLRYDGPEVLALNESELAGYRWQYPDGIARALASTRAERRDVILKFIGLS